MLINRQTNSLDVVGYFYLDIFGCINTKKSTSSYIFMLTMETYFGAAKKQTLTTTSTMQVEFISYFEATSHGVWLRSFIYGLEL